ncbi:unnamed protein product, partial [Linum tenue]
PLFPLARRFLFLLLISLCRCYLFPFVRRPLLRVFLCVLLKAPPSLISTHWVILTPFSPCAFCYLGFSNQVIALHEASRVVPSGTSSFSARFRFQGVEDAFQHIVTRRDNGFLPARYRLRRCTRFSSKTRFAAHLSLMASNNSQPSTSMGGASVPSKGKAKDSSSQVRKMVYRKAKWRLSEIVSDAESDPQAESLTEGDMSSVELEPETGNFRATNDADYRIL